VDPEPVQQCVDVPPGDMCFDIFYAAPGERDVISHFERLSSKEMKILRRSVRIVVNASVVPTAFGMIASRLHCSATSFG
jgi:hypothetical protein